MTCYLTRLICKEWINMHSLKWFLPLILTAACTGDVPSAPPVTAELKQQDTLMVAILCPAPGTPAADSLGVSCITVVEGGN